MIPLSMLLSLKGSLKLLSRLYSSHKPTLPRSMSLTYSVSFPAANTSVSEEYWKLYESYAAALKKFAEIQDALDTNKRALNSAYAEGMSSLQNKDLPSLSAHNYTAALANKENLDMVHEVKEQNSAEAAQLHAEWDERTQRIHHLESEVEASLVLARESCAERDELRGMLDKKQDEIQAEDQEAIIEMKKLLAELTAQENGDTEASQVSGVMLTRQLGELIDKNLERLAKRAEVSSVTDWSQSRLIADIMVKYIEQQSEHIKSLRERIRHYEENNDEGISKEREVSFGPSCLSQTMTYN